MSIKIGNGNTIKNSTIAEKIEEKTEEKETEVTKGSFYIRHPVLCSILISFGVGFVLLFSYWKDIISFIEGCFNG